MKQQTKSKSHSFPKYKCWLRATVFSSTLIATSALTAQTQQVQTGIDVLVSEQFKALVGKKVGLITNHTGIDGNWRSTIDLIFNAEGVELVALFSPEHGIRGTEDTRVASTVDSATGLPIHSLYSQTRRPTADMLEGLDMLVFDIQDIGARFYTYIGTMKNCMEEAARYGIEFMVLDRPNPINGVQVEGPVLAREHVFELAGIFPMPIRHGMTVGELARMFNEEEQLGVDLTVIRMRGWRRSMWFDQTQLPWRNPSPNMRNLYEAALYPGLGLLERMNVANKKGLERPFEQFGAPWVSAVELAIELNRRRIPGVLFVPIKFVPTEHKYAGELCEGVAVDLVDRQTLPSVRCGVEVLHALYQLYPQHLEIDRIWHLTRSQELIDQIKKQVPVEEIVASWQPDLENFLGTRQKYLLYD